MVLPIVIDEPVYIKDGYVTIYLPKFELEIKQRVKQIKGLGTYDADDLVAPTTEHLTILNHLLKVTKLELFTSRQIYDEMNNENKKKWIAGLYPQYIEIKHPSHIRLISGLLRRGCLEIVDRGDWEGSRTTRAPVYELNKERALSVFTTELF